MRIAFDHKIFGQTHGGISRYFNQLANGLIGEGQKVGVFAPFYLNNDLKLLPANNVHGKYLKRYPPKLSRIFSLYNSFVSRHQISRWQPDLVHETFYSKIASAPKHTPTVITVYDMIHELFVDEFPTRNDLVIKKNSINRADHIICISESTKNDLVHLYGMSDKKISVVHLGFNRFGKADEKLNETLNIAKPFLLYVGYRWGYKNFSGFLKAMASSSRLMSDFDVVAFGIAKFSNNELNLINSLGFKRHQVRNVCGGDGLLGQYYRNARAFVYPSLYEGFGMPPLEAMAHSCPVISSNTSSMPEVIGSAAEFFNPSSSQEIRAAIESVVYSDTRIIELKKTGLERLNHFSWTKCTHQTLEVYRTVTGKSYE